MHRRFLRIALGALVVTPLLTLAMPAIASAQPSVSPAQQPASQIEICLTQGFCLQIL